MTRPMKLSEYIGSLEKYCDDLEKENKMQKEYYAEVIHDLEIELEGYKKTVDIDCTDFRTELDKYKKALDRSCDMLESFDLAYKDNLQSRKAQTKEQWKEWLLKDE